ncbi:4248f89a-6488-4b15-b872-058bfed90f9e [Thermothielavioides terrestris]|uniref:4248f89a-6488-4b15-b872-058bfed90f9e n=1 Tax=Thermothielavioides terrestris TaxID=2587410 RepID=A0A3S4EYX4_9PEZI|nr:4248f89a-6488-4b15-b872-058bfed90f9e [Thermothielavioides terrestris]
MSKTTAANPQGVLVTPLKIASELSLYGFGGGGLQPYALNLVYRVFTVIKPSTYALQDIAVVSPQDDLFCFTNFSQHPGILHSTLFAAQAFQDVALGQPYSTTAQLHLAKALSHLQRSLDDQKEAVELSTMAVVASLAMAAVIAGDLSTAAKHMDGLHRIIELRGGLQSLGPDSMIEHKARAIDIGLAMAHGTPLRFADADTTIAWSPQLAPASRSASRSFPELAAAARPPRSRPDPRLLNVWADLREFARRVNDAGAGGRGEKVPGPVAARLTTSVPVRLLRLRRPLPLPLPCNNGGGGGNGGDGGGDEAGAVLHEMLRLSMLAFAKMLLIKLRGFGRKMTDLAEGLKAALLAWEAETRREEAHDDTRRGLLELLLWGLLVAGVSIFEDADDEWLGEMLLRAVSALIADKESQHKNFGAS